MEYGLLDTGSESCVISMGFVQKHNLNKLLTPSYAELQTFGAKVMATKYKLKFNFNFLDSTAIHSMEAVVSSSNEISLVIGQNIFRGLKLNIDYEFSKPKQFLLKSAITQSSKYDIQTPLFDTDEKDTNIIYSKSLEKRYSVPYVKTIIWDSPYEIMIDTGSMRNVIEYEIIEQEHLTHLIHKTTMTHLRGAKSKVKILGDINLSLKFISKSSEKHNVQANFAVVKHAGESITVGLQFLLQNQFMIDNGTNTLKMITGMELPIFHWRDIQISKSKIQFKERQMYIQSFYRFLIKNLEETTRKLTNHLDEDIEDKIEDLLKKLDNMEQEKIKCLDYFNKCRKLNNYTETHQITHDISSKVIQQDSLLDNGMVNLMHKITDTIQSSHVPERSQIISDIKGDVKIIDDDSDSILLLSPSRNISVPKASISRIKVKMNRDIDTWKNKTLLIEQSLPLNKIRNQGLIWIPPQIHLAAQELNLIVLNNSHKSLKFKRTDILACASIAYLDKEECYLEEHEGNLLHKITSCHPDYEIEEVNESSQINLELNNITVSELEDHIKQIIDKNMWLSEIDFPSQIVENRLLDLKIRLETLKMLANYPKA